MRGIIISLVLGLVILVYWSIVAINRAITEPSWICMLDGAIMMAYFWMSIDNARHLVEIVGNKKQVKETNNEESN
jgi:uncharacterized protein YacL